MYARQPTWIERGPRRFNEYGLSGLGQVYPGSSCYDNSHDAGMIHCASASSVIAGAFNPFGTDQTTTCSAQEQACVTSNPSAAGAGATGVTTDACTPVLGFSCGTATFMAIGGLVALVFLTTMAGRR